MGLVLFLGVWAGGCAGPTPEPPEPGASAENLYLAEQVARYPDRLVGACSVNPLASYALEELELCSADPRITAFSLHLAPAPVDFSDETHVARLRTFFEALARTDLPVIVHMRNRGEGYGAGDAGVFIREVLAAAPGVPVQIAHMAGWGPYDEATDSAMQAFVDAFEEGTLDRDRVTFGVGVLLDDPVELDDDTAAARRAAERNTRLAERMRRVGIERVVFSTDWPFFPPHGEARTRIARNRARLRDVLPLEPEELDRFFSNVGPVFRLLVESHSTEQGSRERRPSGGGPAVGLRVPSGARPDLCLGTRQPGYTERRLRVDRTSGRNDPSPRIPRSLAL